MKTTLFSVSLLASAEAFGRLDVLWGLISLAACLGLLWWTIRNAGREIEVAFPNVYGYRLDSLKVVEIHRSGQTWAFRFRSPSELITAVTKPSLGFTVEEVRECERLAVELCSVEI